MKGIRKSEEIEKYPRLVYMLDYMFQQQFDLQFELVANLNEEGLELSPIGQESSLVIPLTIYLKQEVIDIKFKTWFEHFIDQRVSLNSEGLINFDFLAGQFFLLSRFEEYLPFVADQFGRYQAKCSCVYQKGFLQVPLVDRWTMDFEDCWNAYFPKYPIKLNKWSKRNLLTIDIDKAYAYQHASLLKLSKSMIKSIFTGKFNEAQWKWKVWKGLEKDPFDNYEYLREVNRKYGVEPMIFILCGKSRGYDENLGLENERVRNAVLSLAKPLNVGLHPSIHSTTSLGILQEEKAYLERYMNFRIKSSRQHFLKFSLPQQYEWLCTVGIEEDHTMGYAEEVGFRAGTSKPFQWFQLSNNKITSLEVVPFVVMDTTLSDYLSMSPTEAIEKVYKMKEQAIRYGGRLSVLMHQESPGGYGRWKGWEMFYEQVAELISE